MGCKGSKDAAGADDKKIDSEFATTGFEKIDQLFSSASEVLEQAEKIRSGLEDSKEDGMEIAGTDQLKDPKYVETLRVLLWAISAQARGKIFDLVPDVSEEKPYLHVKLEALNEETRNLYNTFKEYVNTIVDGPEIVETTTKKLQELVEMIPDTLKDAKSEIGQSSLSFKEKAQAMMKIKKNSEKLPKQLAKCKRLAEILKETATDFKQVIPELKTLVKSADEIGRKADDEQLYTPKEIFEKFHTGERVPEGKTESKPAKKEGKKGEKAAEEKHEEKPVENKPEEKHEEKHVEKPVEKKQEEKHEEKREEKHEEKHVEKKEEMSPEKKHEEKHEEKHVEKSAEKKHEEKPVENKPEEKHEEKHVEKSAEKKHEEKHTAHAETAHPKHEEFEEVTDVVVEDAHAQRAH